MPLSDEQKRSLREAKKKKAPSANIVDLDSRRKPDLDSYIDRFNESYAVLWLGGKCVIMREYINATFSRPDICFTTVKDFENYYLNDRINIEDNNGKIKNVSKASLWLKSPKRRQYDDIVFDPTGKNSGNAYNLFRGFALKPKKGDWSLHRKHLFEVICGEDEERFQYLLVWCADALQNPGAEDKPGVSIAIKGGKGAGKGRAVKLLSRIYGQHFIHITDQNKLTGKFNVHLKNVLLVFCDEGFWAGDKRAEGTLKGMITEDTFSIEPKGKDVFTVKNHLRIIVSSNEDWCVPATLDERRWFVVEASGKYIGNRQYFDALKREMEEGASEAFLYDMLKFDTSKVDLRQPPKTYELLEQAEYSMDKVTAFWLERLKVGYQLKKSGMWLPKVGKNDFYQEYIEYCNNVGEYYKLPVIPFIRKIKHYCPTLKPNQKMPGDQYNERIPAIVFPSLELCRASFCEVSKWCINWEDYEEENEE